MPLAKIKAGSKPPWHGLSVAEVSELVHQVFDKTYVIKEGDAWCDLVCCLDSNSAIFIFAID